MKKLSESTIKRYNKVRLMKHLERFLSYVDSASYRVHNGSIYQLSNCGSYYEFYCSAYDRDDLIEVLRSVYAGAV
jgi:hypothetical protein